MTVPANTTALTAEVFTSGHGSEEEDWWNAPYTCVSGGIPYREVAVSVDGQLAGTAPIFPTIYTGGYGPDFWRPFPSPRAYNLRPYDFDLSPWIGQLTDGTAHTITLDVLGQDGCSGYWFMCGNLLVTTNHVSTGRTTGAITAITDPALPTNTSTTGDNQTSTASDMTTSAHDLDITGTLVPAGATTPTVVHVTQSMTNSATDAVLDVVSNWTWDSASTRTTGARTDTTSQSSTYELLRSGPSWTLEDNQDITRTAEGTTVFSSSLADTMNTVGAVVGITGAGNSSTESWKFSTSDGLCVDHELVGAAQNVVSDTSNACTSSNTASAYPGPATPRQPMPTTGKNLAAASKDVIRSRRVSTGHRLPDSIRGTG